MAARDDDVRGDKGGKDMRRREYEGGGVVMLLAILMHARRQRLVASEGGRFCGRPQGMQAELWRE